jgi:hypothetical protein
MSDEFIPQTDPDQPVVYQIRIKGHLGPQWTAWFEGMAVTREANGNTLLTGPVIDQAALIPAGPFTTLSYIIQDKD